jgi:hypothetical protein
MTMRLIVDGGPPFAWGIIGGGAVSISLRYAM